MIPDIKLMIDFAVVSIGLTIALMGLFLSIRSHYMEPWLRNFFTLVFLILVLYTGSNLASQVSLIYLGDSFAVFTQVAIFMESFFSSLLMLLLSYCMLRFVGGSVRSRLFIISFGLWCVYLVLLIITQFTGIFYYITPENEYHRGTYYPFLLVPAFLILLANIIGLYNRRNKLPPEIKKSFLIYFLIPVVSILIQMTSFGTYFIVLGTSAAALVMLLSILTEQMNRFTEQQSDLLEQRIRIHSLMIRPHFIFNTLSNIYYLCDLDPKKAQSVINDFTVYLRDNINSVAKADLIPFETELEHTKAFLAVVKARYEDQLFVEYDIRLKAFRIPPLTLEPLVENAIKHGLDPESSPLSITITTFKSENGVKVVVENSGDTFPDDIPVQPPVPGDSEPHIGLYNVSERLKALCGGSLTIVPGESGGTVATIFIPDKETEK